MKRLLLIEDDQDILESMRALLEDELGVQVTVASTVTDGERLFFESLANTPFDAVLIDGFVGEGGAESTRELLQMIIARQDFQGKIIAMSGSEETLRDRASLSIRCRPYSKGNGGDPDLLLALLAA